MLPTLFNTAYQEAASVDAHFDRSVEDRVAEDIRCVEIDVAVGQLLTDDVHALVGADGPPAVSLVGIVDLLSDGEINDVERLVAHREFCMGLVNRQDREQRCADHSGGRHAAGELRPYSKPAIPPGR